MIKAVLFDLDNTLIDFMKMKKMCVENAADAMIDAGLEMGREEATEKLFKEYWEIGIEHDQIFQRFLEKVDGEINYKILGSAIAAYRKTVISYLEPYPHVTSTLTELKIKGIKIGIVTDAPRIKAWIRLCALKLHHLPDTVITVDDTGERKPSTKPFKKALQELQTKPQECLMVGDWIDRDIEGAKKLGIKTCFAKYGHIQGKTEGADHTINDIKELLEIIDNA